MDLGQLLAEYHEDIVNTWFHLMRRDDSSPYSDQPEKDLRRLVGRAAKAFRLALVDNQPGELSRFVDYIARRRIAEGFKLSEVQKAFELYRQVITPLLVNHIDPGDLIDVLLRLHRCMVDTVTRFSEYFQDLHEAYLVEHTNILEKEVNSRTRQLAESERKYKTLVEDINDGYFVLINGRIVFANKAFAVMHGRCLPDILGKNYLEFVAPESRALVQRSYENSKCSIKEPALLEYLRLHRDGRRLPTEIMAKRSFYQDQVATIGICRDITQRVQLEKKIQEAERLKALANLAGSIAHEIRNPLTAIKMNTQILLELSEVDVRYKNSLQIMLEEIANVERSVNEMMDLTIPFRLECQWTDLPPLLESCLETMLHRLTEKRIKISVKVDETCPQVYVDPKRIQQAIVNILFNAVELLPLGGQIEISSRVVRKRDQSLVEIKVADNGEGMPQELLPFIFDPFFTKKGGGTGLGLANVKKIVTAHGGQITASLRKPKGLIFCIHLPQGGINF